MPNYYEQLKLQPSATTAEIEIAIEEQYNQWRRLVTHHDANIVNQANLSLQTLESIRGVLTNIDKRSAYDAGIGVSGPIGGLADPAALLRANMPFTPPATATSQPRVVTPNSGASAADAWVCPKCQTINPLKTKFCSKCGQQLGLDCPSCGKLTRSTDPFCAECGVNFEDFERRMKIEDDEKQSLAALHRTEIELARKWLAETESTKNNYRHGPVYETILARGSFSEVFEQCQRSIEKFRYVIPGSLGLMSAETKIKEVVTSTGYIKGVVGGTFSTSGYHWDIHVFVQKNLTLCRGVAVITAYSSRIWASTQSTQVSKQLSEALSAIRMK
jgi:hypothetical protein